jgi:hypothetical protein
MLAFGTAEARRWEPKRLRLRLFSVAAKLATTARTVTPAPVLARAVGPAAHRRSHRAARTARPDLARPPRPDDPNESGPWNRRPPERPRAISRTPPAESPVTAGRLGPDTRQRTADERSGLAVQVRGEEGGTNSRPWRGEQVGYCVQERALLVVVIVDNADLIVEG